MSRAVNSGKDFGVIACCLYEIAEKASGLGNFSVDAGRLREYGVFGIEKTADGTLRLKLIPFRCRKTTARKQRFWPERKEKDAQKEGPHRAVCSFCTSLKK